MGEVPTNSGQPDSAPFWRVQNWVQQTNPHLFSSLSLPESLSSEQFQCGSPTPHSVQTGMFSCEPPSIREERVLFLC
jgi:hypothetical protein